METIKLNAEEIKKVNAELLNNFAGENISIYDFAEGEDENGVEIFERPWFCVVSDNYDAWDDGSYNFYEAAEMAKEKAETETGVKVCAIHESQEFCVAAIDAEELN